MTTPRILNEAADRNFVEAAYDGSIAVPLYSLMYHDTNDAKPAASQADGGTEDSNQETFGPNFLGVAAESRATTDAAGTIKVWTDIVAEFDCASATFEIGDLVTVDEASSGTALENTKLEKTTSTTEHIGYVIKRYASATTRVWVRLTSRVVPHTRHITNPLSVSSVDLDGAADGFILDADADTTISAPTDDQIDIEIAGADDFTFTANSFNVLTGSAIDLADSCQVKFGSGDDVTIAWDGTDLDILAAADDSVIKFGNGTNSFDIWIYGETASDTIIFDASGKTLTLDGIDLHLDDNDILAFGDDQDCTITFNATNLVISPLTAGGAIHIGDSADTAANLLHIFDGGAEKPGMLVLYSGEATGVPYYLWVDNTGDLRIHTAVPSDEDVDGTVVGSQS